MGFGIGGGLGNMQQLTLAEAGRAAVAEMGRLVSKFGEGGAGRLWLLGTATCETYLRCQVYHPTMENDWDLQAVPITTRASLPGIFPRYSFVFCSFLQFSNAFSSLKDFHRISSFFFLISVLGNSYFSGCSVSRSN